MARIVTVQDLSGNDIALNLDKVWYIVATAGGSRVFFDREHYIDVKHSPGVLASMANNETRTKT
jgi:hypothetical protein